MMSNIMNIACYSWGAILVIATAAMTKEYATPQAKLNKMEEDRDRARQISRGPM